MTGLHRTALVALVATAGALAICMALPSFDPSCAMAPDARAMGACAAAQAGSREVALLGLVIGAIVGVIVVASVAIQVVLHHRVSRQLRRQARPAVLADHQIGLVPGIGAALVAGIRRPRTYCSDDLVTRLDTDEIRANTLIEYMTTSLPTLRRGWWSSPPSLRSSDAPARDRGGSIASGLRSRSPRIATRSATARRARRSLGRSSSCARRQRSCRWPALRPPAISAFVPSSARTSSRMRLPEPVWLGQWSWRWPWRCFARC